MLDEHVERRWIEKNLLGIDHERLADEERRSVEADERRRELLAKARDSIRLALEMRRKARSAARSRKEDESKRLALAYESARKVARRWADEYRDARAAARNAEISLRILRHQKQLRDEEEEMAVLLTLTLLDEED